MIKIKNLIVIVVLLSPLYLFSQQLVYKPINPAFGGDTFNYNWLLSSAESQNKIEGKSANSREPQTDLERFTDMLNRQLLSSISRDLFTREFGDASLEEGTYVFGSLVIEIVPSLDGLSVNILDVNTGDQTQIVIPNG